MRRFAIFLASLSCSCTALVSDLQAPVCTTNDDCAINNTTNGISDAACWRYQCVFGRDLCALAVRDDDHDGAINMGCRTDSHAAGMDVDCDDADVHVHPGAPDICNGRDDDCDGITDPPPCACADGTTQACGLSDPTREGHGVCHAGVQTCRGTSWGECVGAMPPSAEVCNGSDDDCDDLVDDLDPNITGALIYYRDNDGDGRGNADLSQRWCMPPAGWVASSDDCDDSTPLRSPANVEMCNGIDDNCDEITDPPPCTCVTGAMQPCGIDPALEGHGVCHAGTQTCLGTMWGDCVGVTAPSAEVCDGMDNDCDDLVDDADPDIAANPDIVTYYADSDGDGHGNPAMGTRYCMPPAGRVTSNDDCDDTTAARSPANNEATYPCDGLDNNCNSVVDEAGNNTRPYYLDNDRDGYGTGASLGMRCIPGFGYAAMAMDCQDGNPAVHPASDFHTDPICMDRLPPCMPSITTGGLGCPAGAPPVTACTGTASFYDFDCSGAVDLEFPRGGCSSSPTPGVCTMTSGWNSMLTSSACGTSQAFVTGCFVAGCTARTEMRTVRCR